jgi:thiol-disulfide isomerase/thioredoxin
MPFLCCHSFQPLPSNVRRNRNPHFYADSSIIQEEKTTPVSFELLMRERLKQQQQKSKERQHSSTSSTKSLVSVIHNLYDFKDILDKNVASDDHQMVAVLWYAPWCRACKAVKPHIKILAKHHPNTKFIQVPITEENTNLHQGLNVPSVPFMHLYDTSSSDTRLVEESKMMKNKVPSFRKALQDYETGYCSLEEGLDGDWSSCPY